MCEYIEMQGFGPTGNVYDENGELIRAYNKKRK